MHIIFYLRESISICTIAFVDDIRQKSFKWF